MSGIDRERLAAALDAELERFRREHPRSRELFEQARRHWHDGVPMNWMVRWAGDYPIFVTHAEGARFTDVDGHEYVDFCLGDTGAMCGHAPAATVAAACSQLHRGATFMLPTEDALWVADELARRFGLPYWQMATTATDANRFSIRLARLITGRPRILVHAWCYHGSVDETFAILDQGRVVPRPGNLGPPVHPAETTRVVEFNDIAALEAELAHGDVACVLAEPVMTNIGIVHPEPGYHQALRELTRRAGTLLIIDETHTICAGPGGYTRAFGLEPDMLTIGKPIAGGIPAAVYGFSADIAERIREVMSLEHSDTGGIGGTLAGNALSLAAVRATLGSVLDDAFYAHAIPLAERFTSEVLSVIERHGLPWTIQRLGCRAEYWFAPIPPRDGSEAARSQDAQLDRYMHLAALNRGILMTPFHNMALMCRDTRAEDVSAHTRAFADSVAAILA